MINRTVVSNTMPSLVTQFAEPPSLRVFRLTLMAAILLASFVGNVTVMGAALRSSGKKSFTYSLVFNLAFAELVSTCCLPFLVAYLELTTWPFGELICHLISPLQVMAGLVVTSTIAIIAAYRCSLVLQRSKGLTNGRRIGFCVGVCVWFAGFAVSLPSIIYTTVVVPAGGTSRWCLTLLPGDSLADFPSDHLNALSATVFMLNYAVSGVIIIVAYGIVIVNLGKRNRVTQIATLHREADLTIITGNGTQEMQVDIDDTTPHSVVAFMRMPEKQVKPVRQRKRPTSTNQDEVDILKMFYAIVVIFVGCYFPYQVFFLMERYGHLSWMTWRYFDITRSYIFVLTCMPSALHPLCYGLMSPLYTRVSGALCCK